MSFGHRKSSNRTETERSRSLYQPAIAFGFARGVLAPNFRLFKATSICKLLWVGVRLEVLRVASEPTRSIQTDLCWDRARVFSSAELPGSLQCQLGLDEVPMRLEDGGRAAQRKPVVQGPSFSAFFAFRRGFGSKILRDHNTCREAWVFTNAGPDSTKHLLCWVRALGCGGLPTQLEMLRP